MRLLNFFFVFLYIFIYCQVYGNKTHVIENGVLNLSDWNFQRNGTVEFIPFLEGTSARYDKAEDSAIFDITIILPAAKTIYIPENLAVKIPPIDTEYCLWINDEIALSNRFDYINHWVDDYHRKTEIISFINHNEPFHLILKISRFSYIKLIREPFLIGTDKQIREMRLQSMFKEGMIIGVFFFIFIINLFLWIINRKQYSFLIIGLFSLIEAVNLIGRGETVRFLSFINDDIYLKTQLLFLYSKLLLISSFFLFLFYKKSNFYAYCISSGVLIALYLTSIFLPEKYIILFLSVYYLFLLVIQLYYLSQAVLLMKSERKKAFISLILISVLLVSYFIDTINYHLYLFSITLISYGYNSALIYGFIAFAIAYTYYLFINLNMNEAINISLDKFASGYGLSHRETDVLIYLIKRYGYKEIANKLFVSYKTVETHVYHIYQKTGVSNKEELINLLESYQK